MSGEIPRRLHIVGTAAAIGLGGFFALSLASFATIKMLQGVFDAKRCAILPQREYRREQNRRIPTPQPLSPSLSGVTKIVNPAGV